MIVVLINIAQLWRVKQEYRRVFFLFFFFLFFSRPFTIHSTTGEGRGYSFNSSLPLPPASQALRYQSGNYCRELTSTHSQQPDLKPVTIGFRAQVANHLATRPKQTWIQRMVIFIYTQERFLLFLLFLTQSIINPDLVNQGHQHHHCQCYVNDYGYYTKITSDRKLIGQKQIKQIFSLQYSVKKIYSIRYHSEPLF